MKIIDPSVELIDNYTENEILKKIELAGRTCYKSEDKITETSAKDFVKRIINSGHHSVLEHVSLTVKIICDRGVSHELVRHRIAAYSQECVSGETQIHKSYTIKELFERQNGTKYDKTHNKTIHLKSMNENGYIVPSKFEKIFYKGIQDVYEIETNLGYKLKCTMNHKFLGQDKVFKELRFFNIGDKIYVNGRKCLLKIDDESLQNLYLTEKLNPLEISEVYGCPYTTVLRRLKKIGIFKKRLNDKNKEKYNKNHTEESYKKMRNTILKQYRNGRVVWNKGIKENEHPLVKKQAESLRKHHWNNLPGKMNSNWKGGPKNHALAQKLKKDILLCELCNSKMRLEVHNKDGDVSNNNLNNLVKVCCKCHNLLHHNWYVGKYTILDEIKSINYVGKEEVYDIEMKESYHNYIANGFVVHNSTRYCNYKKDRFGREITVIKPMFWNESQENYWIWFGAMAECEKNYLILMDKGSSPQEARSVLPNSLKTEIVTTMNIREWRYVLNLRTKKNVHPEMQKIMILILNLFKEKYPNLFGDIYNE